MEHKEELRLYHSRILDAIKTIYDPEIPVNIYDLGLRVKYSIKKPNIVWFFVLKKTLLRLF